MNKMYHKIILLICLSKVVNIIVQIPQFFLQLNQTLSCGYFFVGNLNVSGHKIVLLKKFNRVVLTIPTLLLNARYFLVTFSKDLLSKKGNESIIYTKMYNFIFD